MQDPQLVHVTVNVMSEIIESNQNTNQETDNHSFPGLETQPHALRRPLTQLSLPCVQPISELGLRRVLKGNQNRFCACKPAACDQFNSFLCGFVPTSPAVFSSGSGAVGSRRDFLAVSDGGQAVL